MKSHLVVAIAMLHLVVAALFSTHVVIEERLPDLLGRALRVYGDYTGARTHFDYFAPAVAPQARASFVLFRTDGTKREVTLATGNAEADQRIAMMLTFLGPAAMRASIMHSWCVHFLERDPALAAVEARVEIIDIPTVSQARAGAVSRWLHLDRYRLTREQIS